ncbi:hypothetical protein HYC85_029465 [Camellia sinensis]|uniref:Retrotransposon gag domain-containing protein n=1 Tax=Camellia sinensis TaxID=4442 RepID=A0A7J7G204_CAMSI|nr:hypothetical protein HYC85_029465 [Camellia sinensis]
MDVPTGPALPPILPQLSKTPTNLPDSPFEFEVDPTALKVRKLEKLFKKSQGVKSIPDIEDGYTDSAVTLPDRFKMPHIDRFNGFGDPMVHLQLFSDILRPMGLSRLQKLSLFGRTLSSVAAIWYAKLEDSVKMNWDEMAEAFVAQYSYNTQIEVTTRDLETTRQEPKESFSDFVTRWRAKASTMTIRPVDKYQIGMIVCNLQPKLVQKMIVLPLSTFADLHEIGVQIEDAMKQGLIDHEREQPRRAFSRSTIAGTSSAAAARASDVSMVTITTTPRSLSATPFTGAFESSSQTTKFPPRGQKTFTPLYMPLSKALGVLIRKGHLKPLEPRPLPEKLPLSHNPAKYCAFHQQHGHDTDQCYRLYHEIQDLVDNTMIVPPEKPNVTTNPLPQHNHAPTLKRINLIQTGVLSYDPSIYITPSHLPKPEVFIPDSTDLCVLNISQTQPETMVVTIKDRSGSIAEADESANTEPEMSASFMYNLSGYITSVGQARPNVELLVKAEICVVREDGLNQGLDDLAELEEDVANLQFFNEQDPGDVTVNWFDLNGAAKSTGWLDDQPDVVEQPHIE